MSIITLMNLPKKNKKCELCQNIKEFLIDLAPHIRLFSDLMDTYDIYLLFKLNDTDFADFYTNNCLEIRRICCDFIKQNKEITSSKASVEQFQYTLDYCYYISRAMDACIRMAKPLDIETRKFYVQIINLHLYRAEESLYQFFQELGINAKSH